MHDLESPIVVVAETQRMKHAVLYVADDRREE